MGNYKQVLYVRMKEAKKQIEFGLFYIKIKEQDKICEKTQSTPEKKVAVTHDGFKVLLDPC